MSDPDSSALPLPGYDDLPIGDLQGRIRALDADQLETLLRYERAHADRAAVVTLLRTRADDVRGGAQLSSGDPAGLSPAAAPPPATVPPVSPQTAGPKLNPPSHGAPENPAQPR
jgi:hypothetical protein